MLRMLVVGAVLAAAVRPAAAVAPCHDVCHLGQGQPLLVVGRALWGRRCTTAKPGAPEDCVIVRLDLDGTEDLQVPFKATYQEEQFTNSYLRNHRVVRLGHQGAWQDLKKPYTVRPSFAPSSTLRLDGDTLVFGPATGKPASALVRRPLGCRPRSVAVFAASVGRDNKPEDPTGTIVAVAVCPIAAATGAATGTREVIAVYRATP